MATFYFLGTFLLLGSTGYGFLLSKMLSSTETTFYLFDQQKYILKKSSNSSIQLLHFIACTLACINMVFAVLGIAMAKGSKAWYEALENAIPFVENSNKKMISWAKVRWEIDLRSREMNKRKCDDRDDLKSFRKDLKNNSIFSTASGAYSPSKINIALGQISLLIWLTVLDSTFHNYLR